MCNSEKRGQKKSKNYANSCACTQAPATLETIPRHVAVWIPFWHALNRSHDVLHDPQAERTILLHEAILNALLAHMLSRLHDVLCDVHGNAPSCTTVAFWTTTMISTPLRHGKPQRQTAAHEAHHRAVLRWAYTEKTDGVTRRELNQVMVPKKKKEV